VTAERQEIWIDFGLSGLTKWFAGPWVSEATPEEIVTGAADWGDGAYAATLLEDALRLLESPLPTRMIELLWRSAIGLPYDPDGVWLDGRAWLRDIVRICVDRIHCDEPSFTPGELTPPLDGPLKEQVLKEIREVSPAVEAAVRVGGAEVVAALQQLGVEVDPDLGFRFFLRVLKAHLVPVTVSQYQKGPYSCHKGYGPSWSSPARPAPARLNRRPEVGVDIRLSGLIKWIRYPVVNSETAGSDVVTSVCRPVRRGCSPPASAGLSRAHGLIDAQSGHRNPVAGGDVPGIRSAAP
jgi:hypothetical protein